MTAFAASVDVLFGDPNLALDAIYRDGGAGAGVPVRVVRRAPDAVTNFGDGRFVTDTVLIDVRTKEARPARGDTFEIGPETFEVISEPVRDSERLIWTCEAREP